MLIANNSPSKKMKSAEYIALSACTMTLTALGIDVMLPALRIDSADASDKPM